MNQPIKKHILLLAVFAATGLMSFAQAGKVINDKNAEKRSVKGFHAIDISSGIDLYLSQGGDEAVAVSASDPSYRDKIRTEVENGTLKIFLDKNGDHWGWGDHKLKAYVSFKDLDALRASGGSDIYAEDGIRGGKLVIELSGGSDMRAKADISGSLTLTQTGGSDSYISGTVSSLTVHASGGSDMHGYDLATQVCNVVVSGGSDVHILVNKELNVNASGGSDVFYKGTAVVKELNSSGSSSVTKKG
jgi:hypothetical protein